MKFLKNYMNNNFNKNLTAKSTYFMTYLIYFGFELLGPTRMGQIMYKGSKITNFGFINYSLKKIIDFKNSLLELSPFNIVENIETVKMEIKTENIVEPIIEVSNNTGYVNYIVYISAFVLVTIISIYTYKYISDSFTNIDINIAGIEKSTAVKVDASDYIQTTVIQKAEKIDLLFERVNNMMKKIEEHTTIEHKHILEKFKKGLEELDLSKLPVEKRYYSHELYKKIEDSLKKINLMENPLEEIINKPSETISKVTINKEALERFEEKYGEKLIKAVDYIVEKGVE